MSEIKPRWTPPNWPKGVVEMFDKAGIRIAQPDDEIYRKASWRISLVSRRVEPKEENATKQEE